MALTASADYGAAFALRLTSTPTTDAAYHVALTRFLTRAARVFVMPTHVFVGDAAFALRHVRTIDVATRYRLAARGVATREARYRAQVETLMVIGGHYRTQQVASAAYATRYRLGFVGQGTPLAAQWHVTRDTTPFVVCRFMVAGPQKLTLGGAYALKGPPQNIILRSEEYTRGRFIREAYTGATLTGEQWTAPRLRDESFVGDL
jgi:hypothetical protein